MRGLRLMAEDEPDFWESLGYHERGDPWKEQRHWGDRDVAWPPDTHL